MSFKLKALLGAEDGARQVFEIIRDMLITTMNAYFKTYRQYLLEKFPQSLITQANDKFEAIRDLVDRIDREAGYGY